MSAQIRSACLTTALQRTGKLARCARSAFPPLPPIGAKHFWKCPKDKREELRPLIIKQYGKRLELIAPSEDSVPPIGAAPYRCCPL